MTSRTNPMTTDAMFKLAERCEQAMGPDHQLDADIAATQGWSNFSLKDRRGALGRPPVRTGKTLMLEWVRRYTASLDAAMTLVPEGWYWQVGQGNHAWAAAYENPIPPSTRVDSIAATPALALCAAALRARSA
jgi:hypothetical protein